MQDINITISIDDVNPTKGYRILGEQTGKWLEQLNKEWGAKFTLFIPSNWHKVGKLSENKEWINELNSINYFELAAHGHYHMCDNPIGYGECEFMELNNDIEIEKRRNLMLAEWQLINIIPKGFRPPGWLISSKSKHKLDGDFEYVAVHNDHSRELNWYRSTPFYGHDDIQNSSISIHNDNMIMYQSHIFGNHNKNVWNEYNFNQLNLSLSHLLDEKNQFLNSFNFKFKTLIECREAKRAKLVG